MERVNPLPYSNQIFISISSPLFFRYFPGLLFILKNFFKIFTFADPAPNEKFP